MSPKTVSYAECGKAKSIDSEKRSAIFQAVINFTSSDPFTCSGSGCRKVFINKRGTEDLSPAVKITVRSNGRVVIDQLQVQHGDEYEWVEDYGNVQVTVTPLGVPTNCYLHVEQY